MMDDFCCGLRVGDKVPDISLDTFDAGKGTFGSFAMKDQKKKKRWTVFFFYPADFTFV